MPTDLLEQTEQEIDYSQLGVLAGLEFSSEPFLVLSEEEKREVKALCVKAAKRDYPARLVEVVQSWESSLFYRGFQFLLPRYGGGWTIPGENTGYGPSMQVDLALLPTNIYSTYGQIIIASLTRSVPAVRFEAQDGSNDAQISAAESAEKFIKVIERNNDLIMTQTDASRYLWCDGRFLYWTRFEKDGQRFGWEEDDTADNLVPENEPPEEQADQALSAARQQQEEAAESQEERAAEDETEESQELPQRRTPRGQEVRTAHGKLEVKLVPMMANNLDECDAVQYETEVDSSRAKGMFPWVADDIKAGGNNTSEGEIARLARQNVKLGMQSTYVTSDSIAEDVTVQRTWMRPSYFSHIANEDIRDSIEKKCPDGMLVAYCGETFCYARNEGVDDAWALGQAFSGDGQNRNALGTSVMPVQKRLNNWLDLINDYFVRGVPKIWMDSKAFDIEATRGQTNIPGDRGSFKRQGIPVDQLVWAEPTLQMNVSLADFVKQYSGPLAELVTGGYPALSGGDLGTNDTKGGIQIQRDQALGRLGPTWHSIKNTEAKSMRQAVRWGAKCRDKSINERIPGGETIRLEVNDLDANILCFAESDENIPETYSQKQNRLMQFMEESSKNPVLGEALYNPANIEFLQSMVALTDLYIPQVASFTKQLGELEMLLEQSPVPNPQFEQAKQKIEQLRQTGIDPTMLQQAEQELQNIPSEVSSWPIDAQTEDNDTEAFGCWKYLNSPEGRKAKRTKPDGFKNVRLHYLEHVQAAQEKSAGAEGQQKPPSKSINFKDMDTDGQVQLAAQAGIKLDAGKLQAEDAQDKAAAGAAKPAPVAA